MKILKFPELRQTYEYDCGAIATQAVLAYYSVDLGEQTIMKMAGTQKSGTPIAGLKKVFKKYGLSFEAGQMTIEDVKKYIDKKIPVILLLQAWADEKPDWQKDWHDGHYVVAIGYGAKKIYFEDPYKLVRTYLDDKELLERWHDIDHKGKKHINWGMAVFGKKTPKAHQAIHMD